MARRCGTRHHDRSWTAPLARSAHRVDPAASSGSPRCRTGSFYRSDCFAPDWLDEPAVPALVGGRIDRLPVDASAARTAYSGWRIRAFLPMHVNGGVALL